MPTEQDILAVIRDIKADGGCTTDEEITSAVLRKFMKDPKLFYEFGNVKDLVRKVLKKNAIQDVAYSMVEAELSFNRSHPKAYLADITLDRLAMTSARADELVNHVLLSVEDIQEEPQPDQEQEDRLLDSMAPKAKLGPREDPLWAMMRTPKQRERLAKINEVEAKQRKHSDVEKADAILTMLENNCGLS